METQRPNLEAEHLYIGDNGRVFCGRLGCAGASAYYTGREASGQAVHAVTADDRSHFTASGQDLRCEGCGSRHKMRAVATVVRWGLMDMQVCVPEFWTDAEVTEFAESSYPSSTSGWKVRRFGDPELAGDPERQPCTDRPGHVHIMLDA